MGKKIKFSDHIAVDLFTNDEVAVWGGYVGEMEITKVDTDWAEGKFYFTATTNSAPDKKNEVTEGFFRLSITGNK